MHKKVEILAPAGCFASLAAGLNAGADAVYFGLGQLNMRSGARKSFHERDLAEIIKRCHDSGAKGYLAVNTILYDSDMSVVRRILKRAAACGTDGVIVADMSAANIANQLGLRAHISTQLSISNYDALAFYAQYCDRVVLARELSLEMIQTIYKRITSEQLTGRSGQLIELEVFAHGALCIAISGRCGMSLYDSQLSANRGQCKQLCRRAYDIIDKKTGRTMILDNHFIMSPNDISTIEFLDHVLASGVSVLKIEGRGRAPEYVHVVTKTFRKAIDAIQQGQYNRQMIDELLDDLKKVYNRGLSSGYYLGRKQGWSKAYGSKATRQKTEIGKITNYYARIGVAEITANIDGLAIGDEYVIIGQTTGAVEGIVDEMRLDDGPIKRVKARDVFSLKVDRKVRRGDTMYKMRHTNQRILTNGTSV